jgi:hypothetical protein
MGDYENRTTGFQAHQGFMRPNYGINLEKQGGVESRGRLSNLVLRSGFKDFHSYLDFVFRDKTERAD